MSAELTLSLAAEAVGALKPLSDAALMAELTRARDNEVVIATLAPEPARSVGIFMARAVHLAAYAELEHRRLVSSDQNP